MRAGGWGLVTVFALALTVVACGEDQPTPAAGAADAPSVAHAAKLFPGEKAVFTGRIAPAGRTVVLQRQDNGVWVTVTEAVTGEQGGYHLSVPATTALRTYRIYSAAGEVDGEKVGQRTSAPVSVRAVEPKVNVDLVGLPIAQASTEQGAEALFPVTTRLTPARVVDVAIQRRSGAEWTTIAEGSTDTTGTYVAGVPDTSSYRAVVSAGNGAKTLTAEARAREQLRRTFNDDFDSAQVFGAQWRTRLQEYAGSRLCSKPFPETVRLGGGVVTLRVLQDRARRTATCKYGTFKNAMIATRVDGFSAFNSTFGTYAARIKFQSGRGQHGAFWLQGPSVTGAEIDVAEYYGDGRPDGGFSTLVHHTVGEKVTSSGGLQRQVKKMLASGETLSNGYHIYSVSWTPSGYKFRLDGRQVFRTAKPYISKVDQFMVLSLLTSDWELPNLDRSSLATGSVMKVDWVRVWQR